MRSGAAYRALSMPFYMENLLGQLDSIRSEQVLHTRVVYHQTSLDDLGGMLAQRGLGERVVRDMTEMIAAQNDGIYDADQQATTPCPTDFRTWCAEVLAPAARG